MFIISTMCWWAEIAYYFNTPGIYSTPCEYAREYNPGTARIYVNPRSEFMDEMQNDHCDAKAQLFSNCKVRKPFSVLYSILYTALTRPTS